MKTQLRQRFSIFYHVVFRPHDFIAQLERPIAPTAPLHQLPFCHGILTNGLQRYFTTTTSTVSFIRHLLWWTTLSIEG